MNELADKAIPNIITEFEGTTFIIRPFSRGKALAFGTTSISMLLYYVKVIRSSSANSIL